ncbi:hypothetical protein [Morganella morganii]|nr:hypothetical protein [Morganella morganii]
MSLPYSNAFIVTGGGSNSALCVLPVYLNDGAGNLTEYGIPIK